tara:strand:+ start:316 stop:474 length:159 start_codon:yes stop_codon:yes gene_type:complete
MKFFEIIKQVFKYALARKKYWLFPFSIILVALAIVLVGSQGSVIAPFIYTLF